MPAFVKNLTFDCVDALAVARFWAAALGSDVDEGSTSERAYVEAPRLGRPQHLVPRRPRTQSRPQPPPPRPPPPDGHGRGGRPPGHPQRHHDRALRRITVLHGPEGNEFCVEPGPDDPHQASGR